MPWRWPQSRMVTLQRKSKLWSPQQSSSAGSPAEPCSEGHRTVYALRGRGQGYFQMRDEIGRIQLTYRAEDPEVSQIWQQGDGAWRARSVGSRLFWDLQVLCARGKRSPKIGAGDRIISSSRFHEQHVELRIESRLPKVGKKPRKKEVVDLEGAEVSRMEITLWERRSASRNRTS